MLTRGLRGTMICRRLPQTVPDITFPLKIVLVGTVVMVGKVELDSTLPTVPTACRRSSPTLEKSVPYFCDVTQTGRRSWSQTSQSLSDHMETRLELGSICTSEHTISNNSASKSRISLCRWITKPPRLHTIACIIIIIINNNNNNNTLMTMSWSYAHYFTITRFFQQNNVQWIMTLKLQ